MQGYRRSGGSAGKSGFQWRTGFITRVNFGLMRVQVLGELKDEIRELL